MRWLLMAFLLALPCLATTCLAQVGFAPRLRALDLDDDRVKPGGSLRAVFLFENAGDGPSTTDYTVYIHVAPVAPGPGARQIGADFVPLLPTSSWPAHSSVEEAGRLISIPADLAPGLYEVYAGLYSPASGERLVLGDDVDGEKRLRLGPITVTGAEASVPPRAVHRTFSSMSATRSAWSVLSAQESGPVVALGSGRLQVTCSPTSPRIAAISLGKLALANRAPRLPARARIRRDADGKVLTVTLADSKWRLRAGRESARYHTDVVVDGGSACNFDVAISAQGDRASVALEAVTESPGFELLDVTLTPILGAASPEGSLVIPTQSGRVVQLAEAQPADVLVAMDWFNTLVCGAAGGAKCLGLVRTDDPDNSLRAVVAGDDGSRLGYLEPRFAVRAEAGPRAARIKLSDRPTFTVQPVGDPSAKRDASWVDAAAAIRSEVKGAPNPMYRDSLLYKIFCDAPGSNDFTTFEQALDVVKLVHQLAPWQKQVAYLVGWQYNGHDTGYPATDRVNERLGGLAGIRKAIKAAAAMGCVLSVHDNFDDAYLSSPAYDEATIARDPEGDLQKGGVWAGGQSYVLACAKYAARAGCQRAKETVERLGIAKSYHIDVLTAVPLRRDYNASSPESTQASIAGKKAILGQFNQLGLDVTSEGFTAPFIGAIGHSWHLWHKRDTILPGEECVPFIPFAFHGGPTTYGNGAQTDNYPRDSALWGAGFSCDWTKHVDPHEAARAIYLVNVPWMLLRERNMTSWTRAGSLLRVGYGPGCLVEADERSDRWRVVVDGSTVVEDGLVTLKRPEGLYLFSGEARRATVAGKGGVCRNLLTGAEVPVLTAAGGKVVVELPASEPVLLASR